MIIGKRDGEDGADITHIGFKSWEDLERGSHVGEDRGNWGGGMIRIYVMRREEPEGMYGGEWKEKKSIAFIV